jgi:hypothetical protein
MLRSNLSAFVSGLRMERLYICYSLSFIHSLALNAINLICVYFIPHNFLKNYICKLNVTTF